MANMSYCMWENTSADLNQLIADVGETLDEANPSFSEWLESKNEYERRYVRKVIKNCRELIELFEQLEEYE